MNLGILLLRLTVGLTLAAHGAQKLFGLFGGPGIGRTAQVMEMLGFYPGRRHAVIGGLVELIGGLLLAAGFLTPVGALLAWSVMIVAGVTAHVKNGFFITAGGFEYTLVLGAAGLTLAFTGPGSLSVDALLGYEVGNATWGLAALALGAIGAAAQLAQRRLPKPVPTAA